MWRGSAVCDQLKEQELTSRQWMIRQRGRQGGEKDETESMALRDAVAWREVKPCC